MSDDDLKQRFTELKRRDLRRAPDLESMLQRRPPRSRWRIVAPVASIAAAAAALALWCGTRPEAEAPRAAVAVGASRRPPVVLEAAPLDFLLEIPESAARVAPASVLGPNPIGGW